MEEKKPRLVLLPQTGVVLDIEKVVLIGEPKPGVYLVALDQSTQHAVIHAGDAAALLQELDERGLLKRLELPREPVVIEGQPTEG